MERDVLWRPWSKPGLEHLHLTQDDAGIVANGVIIGVDHQVFRLRYDIFCDARWRVREVSLNLLDGQGSVIALRADGEGHWFSFSGEPVLSLDGCIDVDISATPFTNTLPIRRLALRPGQSATLSMVYIAVPQLDVAAVEQRYTCLEMTADEGRYRYESLKQGVSGFTAELPVDRDGLVGDYPEVFRRVWPIE
jgi:uncharacterized protein